MKPFLLGTLSAAGGGEGGGHAGRVVCAAFSPADTSRLATGGEDRTLRLWDTRRNVCAAVLSGHEARVNGCVFTPDGAFLVSASSDTTLRVWDATSGACALVLSGHSDAVNGCDISPDGALLVSCSDDNTVKARAGPESTHSVGPGVPEASVRLARPAPCTRLGECGRRQPQARRVARAAAARHAPRRVSRACPPRMLHQRTLRSCGAPLPIASPVVAWLTDARRAASAAGVGRGGWQ